MNVVEACGLSKFYGDFCALKPTDLTIGQGQIVGIIGPNGAGKTTLLNSLLGLTDYDGELRVIDREPRHSRHRLMEEVCFISDVAVLPKWIRVSEAIEYVSGVHPKFDLAKALSFLQKTKIQMDQKVKSLSKGMIVQLHLAIVMSINAKLLVLDEPTLGLDILFRKEFYHQLLNDYFDEDKTIIITTHQVEEIERLLTQVIFVKEGELILNESMEEIEQKYVQLSVDSHQQAALQKYQPIFQLQSLGKSEMIFEGVERAVLSEYGDVRIPSLADIFVAKVQGQAQAIQGASNIQEEVA